MVTRANNLHIPPIDGLRGIAILFVLFHHFNKFNGENFVANALQKLFHIGWIGVDLFFVLSGFLITKILYNNKSKEKYFQYFYVRRALRILPLYYLSIVLLMLFGKILFPVNIEWHDTLFEKQLYYWTHFVNFGMLFSIKGWLPYGTSHFWSLSVEWQFYLLWPFIIFFFDKKRIFIICLCILLLSPIIRSCFILLEKYGVLHAKFAGIRLSAAINYLLTPLRLDSLAVGAGIALLIRTQTHEQLKRLAYIAYNILLLSIIFLLLIFIKSAGLSWADPLVQSIGFTLLAFIFGSLLVIAISIPVESKLYRLLTSPFLSIFAKYSYSMYIFHMMIDLFLCEKLSQLMILKYVHANFLAGIAYIFFAIGITAGCSFLTWHLWEKHFLNLKKFL